MADRFGSQLIFKAAPLAAKFGLVRGPARNRLRVVLPKRQPARFQTVGECADHSHPLREQASQFGERFVEIGHRRPIVVKPEFVEASSAEAKLLVNLSSLSC